MVSLGLDDLAVYQAVLEHPRRATLGVQSRLGASGIRAALDGLAEAEAELARRHRELAAGHAELARLAAVLPLARGEQAGGCLIGPDAVQGRLDQLCRAASRQCLAVVPGGGQSRQSLAASRPLDEAALRRGVRIRTIYQDSMRSSPATLAYARWLAGLGGQVRTSPLLPPRMLIVDSVTAVVPMDPADTRAGAVEMTAPGCVAALTALFEYAWEDASPLGSEAAPCDGDALSPADQALVRLLARGLTDEAAAKRLGVSLRTERRMAADLMKRLDATSRFAAGARAAARGWL